MRPNEGISQMIANREIGSMVANSKIIPSFGIMDNISQIEDLKQQLISHPIVFFDGVCNLCNASVDFVIKNDPHRRFRYAPLQGETAKTLLPEGIGKSSDNQESDWSMVLLDENGCHVRSRAALMVGKHLRGPFSIMARVGLLVPKFIGDFFYRWIAAYRYKIFGKKESCRLPTAEEKGLFLP